MENVSDLLVQLVLSVLLLVLTLVVNRVRHWVAAAESEAILRVGKSEWEFLKRAASLFIHAAEQLVGLETNEDKRMYVLSHLAALANEHGIPIDHDQLEAILEGVFREVKPFLDGGGLVPVELTIEE